MKCAHFSKCASCKLYEKSYEEQLTHKTDRLKNLLSPFLEDTKDIEVFRSSDEAFRYRAEFRIFHEKDDIISYAMNGFDKEIVTIKECKIISNTIQSKFNILLNAIQCNDILRTRLFSIEFISSLNDELLVTLIYHKKIDEVWAKEAKELEKQLNISVIGRSKGIKIVNSKDFLVEDMEVNNKTITFKSYESMFNQPNKEMNKNMLEFATSFSDKDSDLLELYCGYGNFTMAMSDNFNKILATEVSKASIKCAKENVELNGITNIEFVRLNADETREALNKTRVFRRAEGIDLDSYNFKTLLIDPPRSGVGSDMAKYFSSFYNIIYISCNMDTFVEDFKHLQSSHFIDKIACFDQFPYTEHLELGAIIKRKKD